MTPEQVHWLLQFAAGLTVAVSLCQCALCIAAARYMQSLGNESRARLRYAAIATAVRGAEQLYGPGKGEAKRRFVREKMKQQLGRDIDRVELEEAVWVETGREKR